jgi:glutamate carboxypeptidase
MALTQCAPCRYPLKVSVTENLQRLVECESPSEDLEACHRVVEVARDIANEVLGGGAFKVEEGGRPIFWWGSRQPQILLLAHLDTVWPIGSRQPLWIIDGDIARGPGIFDMKAGFIQALYALSEIPQVSESIALIGTTDEEIESISSKGFLENLSRKAQAVLILEPSHYGKVKTRRKGAALYKIKIEGLASHAGLDPQKGINATTEIAHIVLKILELNSEEFETTVVPTVLHSGTTSNSVPAFATLEIDCRSFSMAELDRVDMALKSLETVDSRAAMHLSGGINRPPLETESTKFLYAKLELAAAKLGMNPIGQAAVGGVSDGNLAAAVGAQVLDGLGAVGDGAHADKEFVYLSQIPERITLLKEFLIMLLIDMDVAGAHR